MKSINTFEIHIKLQKVFQFFRFLLKSTNQHGVHSPFVYNYITKGIYTPTKGLKYKKRTDKWLIKSLNYFQPETHPVLGDYMAQNVNEKAHGFSSGSSILVEKFDKNKVTGIKEIIQNMKDNQILLLCLYSYPEAFLNEVRLDKEVTLVVDFYCGCLISKRKEQPKQNFFIRF